MSATISLVSNVSKLYLKTNNETSTNPKTRDENEGTTSTNPKTKEENEGTSTNLKTREENEAFATVAGAFAT